MRWRKMTWAILIWTGLMVLWGVSFANAGDPCTTSDTTYVDACRAGAAIGSGIAWSFLFFLWFVGFIVLAIIWFMTRPRATVAIYGAQGQQVMVTEKEAVARVATGQWRYLPGTPSLTPAAGSGPDWGAPGWTPPGQQQPRDPNAPPPPPGR